MTTLHDINHNSGGAVTAHWGTETDPGGGVDVTAGSALNGTANGLAFNLTNANTMRVTSTFTPPGSNQIRFRIYLDPNGQAQLGDFNILTCGIWVSTNTSKQLAAVFVDNNAGDSNISIYVAYGDGGGYTTFSPVVITDAAHCVEVAITKESAPAADDGIAQWWLDGVFQAEDTAVDNDGDWASYNQVYAEANSSGSGSASVYLDEVFITDNASDDLGCSDFSGYSLVKSSGGLAKSALAVSTDGAAIFLALEVNSNGNQIVFKATRPASPTVSVVYQPGSGSAANVIAAGDPDKMIFFGNFGTDIGVLKHTISTGAESDISPTTIGTDKIQPVAIDPSDVNHLVGINQADQDALETEDGSTWSTLNATLGQTPVAMALIWLGALFPFGGFIAGNDGVDENLEYTPNEFNNIREDTSAALQAVGTITGMDVVVG